MEQFVSKTELDSVSIMTLGEKLDLLRRLDYSGIEAGISVRDALSVRERLTIEVNRAFGLSSPESLKLIERLSPIGPATGESMIVAEALTLEDAVASFPEGERKSALAKINLAMSGPNLA